MRSSRAWSLPVLLLLLLCLPSAAQAQNSGQATYHPTVPSIKSEPAPQITNGPGPKTPNPVHPSKPGSDTRPSVEPEPDEGASEPEPTPRTAPQPKKHPRHRHPDAPKQAARAEPTTKPIASHHESPAPSEPDTPKKSGGGSSPVVALLIAVSVLALISIGVARHRLNR